MEEIYWNRFLETGKIEDYQEDYLDSLTYKISALLESEQ